MIFNSQLFGISLAATLMMGIACAEAAVINVTTTLDYAIDDSTIENDCLKKQDKCSLRAAVQLANQSIEEDVIQLPAGIYKLTLSGAGEDHNKAGDIDIQSSLMIQGDDAKNTIIDGNQTDRILHHHRGVLRIHNVTLQNGELERANGGAIFSLNVGDDDIFIEDSVINLNKARKGAAIFHVNDEISSYGHLSIKNTVIENNTSHDYDHMVLRYKGSNFNMLNSLYEKNQGVISIQSNKIQFKHTEILENFIDDVDLLQLVCHGEKSEIMMQVTQINHNHVSTNGFGKILQILSSPDDCNVRINQSQFIGNLAWSILGFDLSLSKENSVDVSVKDSLIATNIQPDRGSDEKDQLFAAVTIEDHASKSFDHALHFEHIAIINNDFSNHGLVGAISITGSDSSPILIVMNSVISGNKAKRHMIYSAGVDKKSAGNFKPQVSLLNSNIVNNDLMFPGYGSLRSLSGKIKLSETILADLQSCHGQDNIVSLGNNLVFNARCYFNQPTDLVVEE